LDIHIGLRDLYRFRYSYWFKGPLDICIGLRTSIGLDIHIGLRDLYRFGYSYWFKGNLFGRFSLSYQGAYPYFRGFIWINDGRLAWCIS